MLLSIPFSMSHGLFRYNATVQIFEELSLRSPITVNALARKTRFSWGCIRLALQLMEQAEYVVKAGRMYVATDMVANESFTLNLRDSLVDSMLKWKSMRAILYQLYVKPKSSLQELSATLGLPYRTVKAVVGLLRKAGLIVNGAVRSELVKMPEDPLEFVPRKSHREVLRHFISAVKTYYPAFNDAIVLFGEASWGKPTLELRVAIIIEEAEPNKMLYTAEKLILASENVTFNFGATLDLYMMASYVWPQLKLDIVDYDDLSLRSIIEGICIHGHLPANEELFELGRTLSPWSKDAIQEKLEKGYLKPAGDGKYEYTEKAIKKFKEKRSKITEMQIQVGEKTIKLIGVAQNPSLFSKNSQ